METKEKFKRITGYNWTNSYYTLQNIKDPKKREYFKINKNPNDFMLKEHFQDGAILILKNYKYSNILKIDIDYRNNKNIKEVIKKIIQEFNDSCIIEYSPYTGGYHLFFKFKEQITDKCKLYIENYFKIKYNMSIECLKNNQQFKLIFSKFYPICGIYFETEKTLVAPLLNKKWSFEENLQIITNMFEYQKSFYLPEKFRYSNTNNLDKKQLQYSKDNKTNKQIKYDNLNELIYKNLIHRYAYGSGTRFRTQFKIASFCLYHNINYKNYCYICEKCNIYDSKDMKNPIIKEKKLKEAWNSAKNKYNFKNTNINLIKSETMDYISQKFKLDSFKVEKLKIILNYYISKNKIVKYKKNKNRIINDCILVYQEIVGRHVYNKKNKIKYKQRNYQNLNNAVCVSKKLLYKLSKKLKIKNINKIKKILSDSNLIVVAMNIFGKTYSFLKLCFAKHFFISDVNKLFISVILSLKSFSKKIKNKLIIYVNKINDVNKQESKERKWIEGLEVLKSIVF